MTKKISEKQIKMGVKIEKEHTKKKSVAKKIAKDHLKKFPTYYTELLHMEKKLSKKKKK